MEQLGGVITVSVPSSGHMGSGLIDGQQWPSVAPMWQTDK